MKKNNSFVKTFTGFRNLQTGKIVSRTAFGTQLGAVVFAKNDDAQIREAKTTEALVRYDVVLSSDGSYLELYAPVPASR